MDVSHRFSAPTIALGVSGLLNIVLLGVVLWPDGADEPELPSLATAAAVAEAPAEVDSAVEATEVAAAAEEVAPAPKAAPLDGDQHVTIASIQGSIPQTMATAAAPYGDNVAATLSRVLVWDLDLRRDLRRDDKAEVLWSLGTSDTVVIDAARYESQKLGRTITAYRFQREGDAYPSYWSADGKEVPHRLKNSPMNHYEQITALLKDRPTHHGMDFKADTGSEVATAFDGVVTRVNWNWKYNGNSIEVRHKDGVLAKYLHLAENKVKEGDRVRAGQVIALSGNTGRSTGPHLHYQLNQGSKVIDPVDYHGTTQRSLPASDMAKFKVVVDGANARLDNAGALAAR